MISIGKLRSPDYYLREVVDGAEDPADFVRLHRLAEDQVEAYRVGEALILLPDRHREAAARYLSEVLTADVYSEDVGPADADD